jgi:hypothetical protein
MDLIAYGEGGSVEPHALFPVLRAITRKPSCLISCSQSAPEGGQGVDIGKQGAMKPAGRVRGCNDMDPPTC